MRLLKSEKIETTTKVEQIYGEGNGNPLQCSCLEDPMDGGAWWAISSVQSLSCVRLIRTHGLLARQASLSITNSWSLLKPMSIELVIPSIHLILSSPSPAFNLSQNQGLSQ